MRTLAIAEQRFSSSHPKADDDGQGSPAGPHPIVLFDGLCMLCDGFVTWLLRHDHRAVFKIAPLQSQTGLRYTSPEDPTDPERWSIVLVDGGKVFHRSEALLRVVSRLDGVFWLAAALRFVPLFLRDPVYRIVARNRYRWFGKRAVCRVPTTEEAERFLPEISKSVAETAANVAGEETEAAPSERRLPNRIPKGAFQ